MTVENFNQTELPKSYLKRKLVNFICDNCGKESVKPESEYKRNLKEGRKNFCCRSCASSYNGSHKTYSPSEKQLEHLKSISNNRRDEYTPFRYTLRCTKRRHKDNDLDLEYLKELWEKQNGTCPYTNLKLILPEDKTIDTINIIYRASLDRIDSSKDYIKGNVQFVSTPINLMKSTMTDSETKYFLKLISNFTSTFIEE